MQRKEGLDTNYFYIGKCNLTKEQQKSSYNNPHCTEYFCNYDKITSCTKCGNFLLNKKKSLWNKELVKHTKEDINFCKKTCNDGYIYDYIERPDTKSNTFNIDKYKTNYNFYNKKLIYKLNNLEYKVDYENTFPKPKTVVHWGQLKLLLTCIIFFMNVIYPDEKEVHIIYAGSARGDNILLLCDMFPNLRWYLIDPRPHLSKLHHHNQVKEIKTEYFTDDVATYYYNKFKDRKYKLLFISDIREDTSDKAVLKDNEVQANWHKIIQPEFSYFKFRCGYETEKIYHYYKGDIFLQLYAPPSSNETRMLFKKELEPYDYDIEEYQGKMLYFNRVIRPSFHTKSIISNNNYFDHCYDCTYFSYIIKNYISKFPNFNPFDTTDILNIMKIITSKIKKYTQDKIYIYNKYIRNNIIM
jgi:hypothetical protein